MLANDPGLQITTCCWYLLDRWVVPDMRAPYFRVYRNDDEGAEIRYGGRWRSIPAGQLVVIAPNTACAGRLRGSVGHLFLHCSLRPPWTGIAPGVYEVDTDPATTRAAERLRDALAAGAGDPWADLLAYRVAATALAGLPASALRSTAIDPRIARALDAMDAHLADPLANRSLAAIAGMETAAFARRFKQITGSSPQRWYSARRIEHAAELLARGAVSTEAVAEACGFCDRAHFSKVFTRWQGMGPAAWRAMTGGDASRFD